MAKSKTLPIRISEVENLKLTKRADELFPQTTGKNVSKYIRHLIEMDIANNKTLEEKEEECLMAETLFLHEQIVRIGNNLNQIAHASNIIKKRASIEKNEIILFGGVLEELRKISLSINKLIP